MKIIAGLGNPGKKYERTRHNIGFEVVAEIARKQGDTSVRTRFESETIDTLIDGEKTLLMCPQTFMNLSGRAVAAAVKFFKVEPEDVLVISDDLNLSTGRLRMRRGGSAGGQNGLADIIRHLGTDAVPRLRVGIDRPPPGWSTVDYVLGRFTDEEIERLKTPVRDAAAAAILWAQRGAGEAMNRYNSRPEKKGGKRSGARANDTGDRSGDGSDARQTVRRRVESDVSPDTA